MEIKDKKGMKNLVADHLSILEHNEQEEIHVEEKLFLDEQLFMVQSSSTLPWYADFVNYLVGGVLPLEQSLHQKGKFLSDARQFYWDEPNLFKHCAYQMITRSMLNEEVEPI